MSEDERELLDALAGESGSSANYIARTGLRLILGLPVPRWVQDHVEEAGAWREEHRTAAA